MKDSKLLLITVIETCERLYFERQLMEGLLIGARVPGWRSTYDRLLNEPAERRFVHEKFQPLYDLANREADADKALEELLRVLPKPEQWN